MRSHPRRSRHRRIRPEIDSERNHDCRRDAIDGGDDALDDRARVAGLAVIVVTVDREQHFRPDLPEAINDAVDAEIRGTRRPDCADARGRQHRDDCLGAVGQESADTIAFGYPRCTQSRGYRRDLLSQIVAAELFPLSIFTKVDHGSCIAAAAQEMFRKIKPAAFEPAGIHDVIGTRKNGRRLLIELYPAESANRFPKCRRILYRPCVQLVVRVATGSLHEAVHRASAHARSVGLPDDRVRGHRRRVFGFNAEASQYP